MILTPTVNNTLQAEFWKVLNFWIWKFTVQESSHGPSWENLTSCVQMCNFVLIMWHAHIYANRSGVHPHVPHIPVRPRVCKLWTVLTNVGILRLFPGIMTSQKCTESGRLVYTTSGVRARYAGPSLCHGESWSEKCADFWYRINCLELSTVHCCFDFRLWFLECYIENFEHFRIQIIEQIWSFKHRMQFLKPVHNIQSLQLQFESSARKTVSGEHIGATADWISKMGLLFAVLGKDQWTVKNN